MATGGMRDRVGEAAGPASTLMARTASEFYLVLLASGNHGNRRHGRTFLLAKILPAYFDDTEPNFALIEEIFGFAQDTGNVPGRDGNEDRSPQLANSLLRCPSGACRARQRAQKKNDNRKNC